MYAGMKLVILLGSDSDSKNVIDWDPALSLVMI